MKFQKARPVTLTRRLGLTLAVVLVAVGLGAMTSSASADSGITTTGDVNMRSGPGTQNEIITVVPAGVSPTYDCWSKGTNVNGVDVWFDVDYAGKNGFISSFFDDSHYASDEDITSKYSIPPCGAAQPVQTSGTPTSCYGDYCSGEDPLATNCAADAVTLSATDAYNGRLELRWSPSCKTEWGRYTQYPSGSATTGEEAPMWMTAIQDTGYSQTKAADGADAGNVFAIGTYWTPMIYSPSHLVRVRLAYPCGGMTLLDAALDCGFNNGVIPTQTNWG